MAGPYWHMLIARNIVDRFSQVKTGADMSQAISQHPEMVIMGSNGPDIHFYPKGDKRISDLAHGNQPAELGRQLIANSKNPEELAFALGWMSHICTDIVTHVLVNQLVARKLSKSEHPSLMFTDNPVGHYRIEWGIDLRLLNTPRMSEKIPDLETAFLPLARVFRLVETTYREMYQVDLKESEWIAGGSSMVQFNKLFLRAWKLTGRTGRSALPVRGLKSGIYYTTVLPLMKVIAEKTSLIEASIMIPLIHPAYELSILENCTHQATDRFFTEMETRFQDINVDNLEGT